MGNRRSRRGVVGRRGSPLGERDTRVDERVFTMEDMEYMRQGLPNCSALPTVIGGGHMFHYTRASEITEFPETFHAQIHESLIAAREDR
jgi:hypothetical protein